jgi:hypothetical protein
MATGRLMCAVALAAGLALLVGQPAAGQGKTSEKVVKGKVSAEKPAGGKQAFVVTLEVDPDFHIYANPVGQEDLMSNQTTVTVTSKAKVKTYKVDYPPGELVKDKVVGDYKVFKGKVTIKGTVEWAGDPGPLDVAVKIQACNKTRCLLPGTIKLSAK